MTLADTGKPEQTNLGAQYLVSSCGLLPPLQQRVGVGEKIEGSEKNVTVPWHQD